MFQQWIEYADTKINKFSEIYWEKEHVCFICLKNNKTNERINDPNNNENFLIKQTETEYNFFYERVI